MYPSKTQQGFNGYFIRYGIYSKTNACGYFYVKDLFVNYLCPTVCNGYLTLLQFLGNTEKLMLGTTGFMHGKSVAIRESRSQTMLSTIEDRRRDPIGTRAIKIRQTRRLPKMVKESPLELAIKPMAETMQRILDYDPKLVKEFFDLSNPLVRKVLAVELVKSKWGPKLQATDSKKDMCRLLGIS